MSLLCELLAIVVKFMPSSTILLSVSTSENLAGAQGDVPKSGSSLSRRSLYYMHVQTTACNGQVGPTLTFEWVKPPPAGSFGKASMQASALKFVYLHALP